MLTAIRNNASSLVTKILLFLLVGSFALWGIGDIIRGFDDIPPVAEVGDNEITATEFDQKIRRLMEDYRKQTGDNLTYQNIRSERFDERLLNTLIEESLINSFASDMKVSTPDTLVSQIIFSSFADQTGNFNRNVYQDFLTSNNLAQEEFFRYIRSVNNSQIILSSTSNIKIPDTVVSKIYAYRNEKRTAETFLISVNKMPEPAIPTADDVEKFYEQNKQNYLSSEKRNITIAYISLTELSDEYVKTINFSEESLRNEYANNKALFYKPERRRIEHILLPTKELAEEAYKKLQNGQSFADLALALTGKAPIMVDKLERTFAPLGISQNMVETAFALSPGEVSMPTQGVVSSWHVIRLVDIEAEKATSYDEALPKLKSILARNEAEITANRRYLMFEDSIAAGENFADAAKSAGITLVALENIALDREFPLKIAQAVTSAVPENLLRRILRLEVGQNVPMTSLPSGDYVSFNLTQLFPATPKSLDEIKDQLIKDWQKQQQIEAAMTTAENLFKDNVGRDFAALAAKFDATVISSPALARGGLDQESNIDQGLNSRIFSMPQIGDIIYHPTNDGVVVAKLTNIIKPDIDINAADYKNISAALATEFTNDLGVQFLDHLKKRYPVKINQEVIDRILQ
jgi:peptidyl-prolyl cis-trans isomerase D